MMAWGDDPTMALLGCVLKLILPKFYKLIWVDMLAHHVTCGHLSILILFNY